DRQEAKWSERSFRNVLTLDEPLQLPDGMADGMFDDDASSITLDEADVTIIRQVTREIGLEPIATPPARVPLSVDNAAGAGTEEFDSSDYAAYRERVEEAIVEIVGPAVARPLPGPSAADQRGEKPVERFLKALKGK
ncbi:MAG: hypothetical protein ACK4MF_11015, partial [Hyphomicrobiaceae bacterium]